jgi:DNA polymerase III epsilon subunit-like protein
MKYISVDVEADGAIPYKYSMVCFGAVVVEPELNRSFYGQTKPISEFYVEDALKISGFTREQHLTFADPLITMQLFEQWLKELNDYVVFVSDNLAFDWQWINYYFHYFIGKNPFGYSGRRIGDIYCGLQNDMRKNPEWKRKYRIQKHDHNPVNDAIGNAQALLKFKDLGLNINF